MQTNGRQVGAVQGGLKDAGKSTAVYVWAYGGEGRHTSKSSHEHGDHCDQHPRKHRNAWAGCVVLPQHRLFTTVRVSSETAQRRSHECDIKASSIFTGTMAYSPQKRTPEVDWREHMQSQAKRAAHARLPTAQKAPPAALGLSSNSATGAPPSAAQQP